MRHLLHGLIGAAALIWALSNAGTANAQWQSTGGPRGGMTFGMAASAEDSTLYVNVRFTLHRKRLPHGEWEPVTPPFPEGVGDFEVTPSGAVIARAVASSGSDVPPQVSFDRGKTWSDSDEALARATAELARDALPRPELAPGVSFSVLDRDGRGRAVARTYSRGTGSGLLLTLDHGRTWDHVPWPDAQLYEFALASREGPALLGWGRGTDDLYRFGEEGTWGVVLQGARVRAVRALDHGVTLVGLDDGWSESGVLRSWDGGRTWEPAQVSERLVEIDSQLVTLGLGIWVGGFLALPTGGVVAATEVGLYEHLMGGFVQAHSPVASWVDVIAARGDHVAARDFDGHLWTRRPNGDWRLIRSDRSYRTVAMLPNGHIVGTSRFPQSQGGTADLYRASGRVVSSEPTPLAVPSHGAQLVALRSGSLLTSGDGTHRSTDGGHTWERTTAPARMNRFAEDACVPGTVYGMTTTGLYKSIDEGVSWETLTEDDQYVTTEAVAACGETVVTAKRYVSVTVLELSHDGGATWRDLAALSQGARALYVEGRTVVVVSPWGGPGVFVSEDLGATWAPARAGLPARTIPATFAYSGGRSYLGTVHSGVWELSGLPKPDSVSTLGRRLHVHPDTVRLSLRSSVTVRVLSPLVWSETVVDVTSEDGATRLTATAGLRERGVEFDAAALGPGRYAARIQGGDADPVQFVVVRE